MRTLFGIMSAVQPVQTVAALCDAIGTDHPILIHHDFSQQPDFVLDRPNVRFVERPVRTGWANWGFSEGILRLVEVAMARDDWDFFQLLSPTCMPIRSLDGLGEHLAASNADYFIDAVDIAAEPHLLMSHGWRAYARAGRWRQRFLRMARHGYLGQDAPVANLGGLAFPTGSRLDAGGFAALVARASLLVTSIAQRNRAFGHVFSDDFRCFAGSTWFGASRRGCAYLLANTAGGPLLQYFKGMHMADEMLFPSIFRNSDLKGAASIHHVSRFVDARPAWIELADLDEVLASGRYFARKFPEDVDSPVRKELARRLSDPTADTGIAATAAAPVPASAHPVHPAAPAHPSAGPAAATADTGSSR